MGDRYSILGAVAKGGMAQVYLGRMLASAGFSRLVAIKRLHDTLSGDPEFVAMLLDEARLTERIRHTNVVDILDVVVRDGAFALVLEWVEGASVSALFKQALKAREPIPRPIVHAIMQGVLRGLAAAHEARAEDGQPLGIVHRDVSPQNVLVGVDGIARIIDFGVAKAYGKLEATRPGEIRGKYAYMAPEQLMARPVTLQVDVYAAGVMLWELLTGTRLFKADDQRALCVAVMRGDIPRPSAVCSGVPPALDEIVHRATAREPSSRYLDARDMLAALEPFARASEEEVGAWVRSLAAETIAAHQKLIQAASAPTSSRSLETLLLELDPSNASSASAVAPAPRSGPVSVPGPMSNLDAGEATESPVATSTTATPRTTQRAAVAIVASLALLGVLLGAVAISRSSTRDGDRASGASASSVPEAVPVPPPAAPSETAIELEETAPPPPGASAAPSSKARPPARGPAKQRPRTPPPRTNGRTPPVDDPTDHR
ncbi:hypothetical protein BH11MYX4_BH11MYX4_29170 [soil metagenome]